MNKIIVLLTLLAMNGQAFSSDLSFVDKVGVYLMPKYSQAKYLRDCKNNVELYEKKLDKQQRKIKPWHLRISVAGKLLACDSLVQKLQKEYEENLLKQIDQPREIKESTNFDSNHESPAGVGT